ncbi:MAG TPA: hypothetical protein VGJ25_09035 [Gaiellaceae bacterium]|jgi:hypothetical protein
MRRGWQTTEFWLAVAVNVGTFVAALESALPARYAAIAAAISNGLYAVGRGVAKSSRSHG